MKIIQIVPSLHMGGGEKFAVDLCNELIKLDHDVTLCVLGQLDKSMRLVKMIDPKVKIISLEKKLGFDYQTFFKLYKCIKDINPDIVHMHLRSFTYSLLSMLLLKKQFIHTFHTLAEKETAGSMKRILYAFYFLKANVTPVSITSMVRKSVQKRFGNKYNVLITNGVSPLVVTDMFMPTKDEIDSYKYNKNTKVFINVARVTKVKNQELLIDTFKKLKEEDINAILIIVGSLQNEKEYADSCLERASSMNNVFFLDEKENVSDYIACSDIFCLSSHFEGLPLTILESMSLGKPTLSTPVGGIPDVISNGYNGFLSKDNSLDAYVDTVKKSITNKLLKEKDIIKLFEEKYSMVICANKYNKLYFDRVEQ